VAGYPAGITERCPSWLKERDWKSRVPPKSGTVGSNPTLSAIFYPLLMRLCFLGCHGFFMAYEVLARKWRPQIFQDVIGQGHITQTLVNAIKTDRLAHAYLFSGARGVGKTSVARILAKAINCAEGEPGIPCNRCHSCLEITSGSSVDVREIDGASNRGIDEIRELRENIKYMPSSSRFRVYIIDEVHMLTLPAFNALLKTLEEPPSHVKFIFATTEPHRVPVTILSRCQKFDFKRIPLALIVEHLGKITSQEGVEISRSGLALIAREAEGGMRDAESLLDQVVSFAGTKVEDHHITDILGIIDRALIFETSSAVLQGSAIKCFEIVDKIYNYGYDIREFYRSLMDQFRDLLVSLIAPEGSLLDMVDTDRDALKQQAERGGEEKLYQCLTFLISREESLRLTSHPKLVLEAILVKLCHLGEVLGFNDLIAKMEGLENRLRSLPPSVETSGGVQTSHQAEEHAGPESAGLTIGTQPVLNEEHWTRFLEGLAGDHKAMANVLKEWDFLDGSGDTLRIQRGKSSFSATYLDDPDRFERFRSACGQFFGRALHIVIVNGKSQGKEKVEIDKPGSNEDQQTAVSKPVQVLLDVFQGEIKGEVPAANRAKTTREGTGATRRKT
jgi:DNA polymerase III subunit gamma/tau